MQFKKASNHKIQHNSKTHWIALNVCKDENTDKCSRCGCQRHDTETCSIDETVICTICKRTGHYSAACFLSMKNGGKIIELPTSRVCCTREDLGPRSPSCRQTKAGRCSTTWGQVPAPLRPLQAQMYICIYYTTQLSHLSHSHTAMTANSQATNAFLKGVQSYIQALWLMPSAPHS